VCARASIFLPRLNHSNEEGGSFRTWRRAAQQNIDGLDPKKTAYVCVRWYGSVLVDCDCEAMMNGVGGGTYPTYTKSTYAKGCGIVIWEPPLYI
jgi:hypothetical protein